MHPDHDIGNRAVAVKSQGIRPGQIRFGATQFVLCDTAIGHPRPFRADHSNGFGDAVVSRGNAADIEMRKIFWQQVGRNSVGQAAFFAHLFHQAAFKAATTKDLIDQIGGEKIWVIALDSALSKNSHRLRGVEIHYRGAAVQFVSHL